MITIPNNTLYCIVFGIVWYWLHYCTLSALPPLCALPGHGTVTCSSAVLSDLPVPARRRPAAAAGAPGATESTATVTRRRRAADSDVLWPRGLAPGRRRGGGAGGGPGAAKPESDSLVTRRQEAQSCERARLPHWRQRHCRTRQCWSNINGPDGKRIALPPVFLSLCSLLTFLPIERMAVALS